MISGRTIVLAIQVLTCSCGRLGFDGLQADGGSDAPPGADALVGQPDALVGVPDAGGNPAGHIIFVSTATLTGVFTVNQADQLCQTDAESGGLEAGTYKALISITAQSAFDRLSIVDDVRNTNNELVGTAAGFWTVIHQAAVAYANGDPATALVWTGTDRNGAFDSRNCADWTDSAGRAMSGDPSATNSSWIEQSPIDCNIARPFYCMSN